MWKNAIKVICFVLAVLIIIPTSVYVYFTWDKGEFDYIKGTERGTAIIIKYLGEDKDVVVPDKLRGRKVVEIDEFAFSESSITSVKIGDNVTYIGKSAFKACPKLQSVELGKNVRAMGDACFSNCPELKSFKAGPALEKIGDLTFAIDFKLETLDFSENEHFKIVDGIIFNSDMTHLYEATQLADLTEYTIPSSVQRLSQYAFFTQKKLTNVIFNDNITEIPAGLFGGCESLTEFIVPDNVTKIGAIAFTASGLRKIYIHDNVRIIDKSAFYNADDHVTVSASKYSYAEKYAKENKLNFEISK